MLRNCVPDTINYTFMTSSALCGERRKYQQSGEMQCVSTCANKGDLTICDTVGTENMFPLRSELRKKTSLELRHNFARTSALLRSNFGTASLELRHNLARTSAQLRSNFGTTSLELRYNFGTASLERWHSFARALAQLRSNLAQLRSNFGSTSLQLGQTSNFSLTEVRAKL